MDKTREPPHHDSKTTHCSLHENNKYSYSLKINTKYCFCFFPLSLGNAQAKDEKRRDNIQKDTIRPVLGLEQKLNNPGGPKTSGKAQTARCAMRVRIFEELAFMSANLCR